MKREKIIKNSKNKSDVKNKSAYRSSKTGKLIRHPRCSECERIRGVKPGKPPKLRK